MKLQMHAVRFDADQKLLDFIEKKTEKLETFFDRIVDGEVFLKLEKDDNRENKIVEIKLNIPGQRLFVKEQSKSFEQATDLAVNSLKRQLRKHKEKLQKH